MLRTSVSVANTPRTVLGKGSFGEVFKATWRESPVPVAVKEISKEHGHAALKEFQLLRECSHPNVVTVLGCEDYAANVYIVMEFCAGGSLAAFLEHSKGTEPQLWCAKVFLQIAKAIAHCHYHGVP